MAQPANTVDTHGLVGIREDLSDIIYNVDPYETPFCTMASKTKAKAVLHEWQTDTLRDSVATNAHIEGDDTVAESRAATVRLNNYTQIFKNAVTTSGTEESVNKAGRGKEMAYQLMKVAKEQKLDIEKSITGTNQAKAAGSSVAPRYLGSLLSWLKTNTVNETGNGGADPAGTGADARTDDGTPVAFSQARFNTAMQSIWDNSGSRPKAYKCILSSYQMDVASGFVGNNNQRNTVREGRVSDALDIYVSQWGTIEFYPSREVRARDVFILHPEYWSIAELRGMKTEELAKTGDNEKRQVVCELTLCSKNEAASGAVLDNTTS